MQITSVSAKRDFLKVAGASVLVLANAAPIVFAQTGQIPRADTFIATGNAGGPTFSQYNDFNPFRPGLDKMASVTHVLEGLYYYNVLKDELIPWLATNHRYNSDYTAVTVDLREGVTWSDGKKFTVDDVIYTISLLRDNGKGKADLQWAQDMARDVKALVRLSDYSVRIELNQPNPRWFFTFFPIRFANQGIHIVPKHIYEPVGPQAMGSFTALDANKAGWPVGTGAFKLTEIKPERIVLDRRDDWWGAKTGFRPLPAMRRVIFVPFATHEQAAQLLVNNEVDTILEAQVPVMKNLLARYPNITTFSGRDKPYGNIDWWPTSLMFNHDDPQWKDVRVRRAVSLFLNRQQIVDFAFDGAAEVTPLPYPAYPALQPYFKTMEAEIKQFRTVDFDTKAAEALMLQSGATKDSQGFWTLNGKRMGGDLFHNNAMATVAPVVAEQLRRAGFEVAPSQRPGYRDVISQGRAVWWVTGHGASVNDPFHTLRLYHKRHYRPVGGTPLWPVRWQNDEFSTLVDQIEALPPTDPRVAGFVKKALTIFLENQVTASISQFYHRIPMNTTYWKNWPSSQNPYVPPTFWADSGYLMLLGVRKQ